MTMSGIGRPLAADLNVPGAVDHAVETGGAPARMLVSILSLS